MLLLEGDDEIFVEKVAESDGWEWKCCGEREDGCEDLVWWWEEDMRVGKRRFKSGLRQGRQAQMMPVLSSTALWSP